ncbi:hypothetical protein NMY22_g13467 [Coprinellus aureogranulatus]|nr:hypothetical protein NMY22_g13467 [Coprinellus aureogranulatus]
MTTAGKQPQCPSLALTSSSLARPQYFSSMATQRALVLPAPQGDLVIDTSIPIHKPGKDEVLIKVKSAALNPGDAFIKKYGAIGKPVAYPLVLGFDFAGDIVEAGEGVVGYQLGDKVFTSGEPFESKYCAFQEYTLADASTIAKAGLYTPHPVGLGLRSFLEPNGASAYSRQAIFISGGSGSAGTATIQLARLSGFTYIIATASLHNTDYLKSLGATHVIDRHISPDALPAELKKIEDLPEIKYAFDAYGRPDSSIPLAFAAVGNGGHVVSVNPIAKVKPPEGKTFAAFTAGKGDPVNRPHLVKLWAEVTRLLESGEIKPANLEVIPGGLRGVEEGVKRIDDGKVSGVKLVVHVEETDW